MRKSYGAVLCAGAAIALGLLGCAGSARTQQEAPPAGEQRPQSFEKTTVTRGDYLLYLPGGYGEQNKEWPLLLFLHGAGERGDSLALVTTHGPPKLAAAGEDFPFIIVSPQAPKGQWWSTARLSTLLDAVEEAYRVDERRIYVTGLSMGGFGTWALAMEEPERFAAIAPIAGGGEPRAVCTIKDTPTWAFHGARDSVVPVERTREMVKALQACGGDVRYTEYPEAGHDSWTAAYDNPDLYEWLLSHRKP